MPGQRTAKTSRRRRIWWPIRDAIRTARRLSGSVPARSQHWTAGVSQWFGRLMWTPSTWCLRSGAENQPECYARVGVLRRWGEMINGAHAIIYSHDPEADRTFFKEVLALHHVDAGGGWLIFALPPAEVAVHPAEPGKPGHELFLMCRDIDAAVKELTGKGVTVEPRFHDEPWGRLAFIKLPGGGKLGVYQPRHPRALNASAPDALSSKPVKRNSTSSRSRTKSRSTASVNRRSG